MHGVLCRHLWNILLMLTLLLALLQEAQTETDNCLKEFKSGCSLIMDAPARPTSTACAQPLDPSWLLASESHPANAQSRLHFRAHCIEG